MNSNPNGHWTKTTLGEVVDIFDSIRVPLNSRQRKDRQGEYPYYGASGVIDSVDDYLFDGQYVLIAEDGENLNSRKLPIAFIARGQFWVNNHAHIIRGKVNIADDRFLVAWFAQANISGYITGAAQPKLSQTNMKRIELTLPSYGLQCKIASILSAYDDLIENNTRRIAILEEMAQAIYREWFVNFKFPGHENAKFVESELGKIPEGWNCKDLSELGFVGRGKSRHRPRNAPELYGGPYPLFQTGDIKAASTFLVRHSQSYSEDGLAQSKLWEPGTLCITIAANIADTAVLSKRSCFPDSVVGFVPDSEVTDVYFVKLYLDSIKRQMQNVSRGTTQDNLSLDKLLRFRVPTPPPKILNAFHDAVSSMFEQVLCLIKKNDALRETRDLLLPKLISGQLNVEDLDIDTGVAAEDHWEATA